MFRLSRPFCKAQVRSQGGVSVGSHSLIDDVSVSSYSPIDDVSVASNSPIDDVSVASNSPTKRVAGISVSHLPYSVCMRSLFSPSLDFLPSLDLCLFQERSRDWQCP